MGMNRDERRYVPYAELTGEDRARADSDSAATRMEAALSRLGCDKLIEDGERAVAFAAALSGWSLVVAASDADPGVRRVAARHGYGIDALAEDPDADVRCEAYRYLRRSGMTLEEWAQRFPARATSPADEAGDEDAGRAKTVAELSVEARAKAREANAGGRKRPRSGPPRRRSDQ